MTVTKSMPQPSQRVIGFADRRAARSAPNADSARWADLSITAVSARRSSGSACARWAAKMPTVTVDSTGSVDGQRRRCLQVLAGPYCRIEDQGGVCGAAGPASAPWAANADTGCLPDDARGPIINRRPDQLRRNVRRGAPPACRPGRRAATLSCRVRSPILMVASILGTPSPYHTP